MYYYSRVMMTWPKTHEELIASGWIFRGESACKNHDCGAKLLWYKLPSGQITPIDYITNSPHWMSCAGDQEYRRKRNAEPAAPVDPQGRLF